MGSDVESVSPLGIGGSSFWAWSLWRFSAGVMLLFGIRLTELSGLKEGSQYVTVALAAEASVCALMRLASKWRTRGHCLQPHWRMVRGFDPRTVCVYCVL